MTEIIRDQWLKLCEQGLCELNPEQLMELVNRLKDLTPEEERHKQELLFNSHPKS